MWLQISGTIEWRQNDDHALDENLEDEFLNGLLPCRIPDEHDDGTNVVVVVDDEDDEDDPTISSCKSMIMIIMMNSRRERMMILLATVSYFS